MLKDRVVIKDKGFQILEDLTAPGREAYFTTFSLKDEKAVRNQMYSLTYYTPLNTMTQPVENRSFVCVWEETTDNKQIEEYTFYFTTAGAKPKLQWSIEKAKKYGSNAYMITLKWKDHYSEPIHRSHIWLKHKRSNSRFTFLRELIEPLDANASEPIDQYIIEVPAGVDPTDLVIEGDELLQQKYLLMGV